MKASFAVRLGSRILSDRLKGDVEASIFAFTLLVGATVMAFFGIKNYLNGIYVVTQVMGVASFAVYFAIYWLRRTDNVVQSANILQFGTYLAVVVSCFWSGGLEGNNFIWIPISIFVGAFYLDFRSVVFWGISYFVGTLLWHFGPSVGIPVVNLLTPQMLAEFKLYAMSISIFTSLWVAWNYRSSRDLVAEIVKEQEKHLIKANSDLEVARAQVEVQLEENVNLVRMLTHDIANPLSVIEMWQIFLPEDSQAKPRISRALESMRATLSYVRDYRAVLDGKKTLNRDKVDFRSCLIETVELFAEKLEGKKLKIVHNLSEVETWVRGDHRVISNLVLANLISNAIKFSYEGGLIETLLKCEEDKVVFVIRDHGIGMPESILNHIFQINKATSRFGTNGEKGTGYGMPLIKHYVEMLDGKVKILSWDACLHRQNCGTEIQLEFPIYQEDSQVLAA